MSNVTYTNALKFSTRVTTLYEHILTNEARILSAPAEHDSYVPKPIVHDKFRVGQITGSIEKNRLRSQTLILGFKKNFFY